MTGVSLHSEQRVEMHQGQASTHSALPPSRSHSPGGQPFLHAARNIPPELQISFTTPSTLAKCLQKQARSDTTVRILVSGITEEKLDEALDNMHSPRHVRVWVEPEAKQAIVTLLPSGYHDMTTGILSAAVIDRLVRIPGHSWLSFVPVMSTRFHTPGKRAKEADAAFKCRERTGARAWPNLVIEVGFSESLAELHMDAEWWLLNSEGNTRMVIVVNVKSRPETLHIEAWRLHPNPGCVRQNRSNPAIIPTLINAIDIDEQRTVSPAGASMVVPYDVIFDNPHPQATDLIFTAADLSDICLHIFDAARE